MEELIKHRKGAAKYFVDLARYPDPFDHEERNILSALMAQEYQKRIYTPFLITDHAPWNFFL